ncbi:transglycosylase domain-containing protein [Actinocatenispora sera]|uniref:transglycosylase domain-containing protein n=1 Tax=Actinocatenispora sera TaxID=390989 RepID=UPI0033F3FCD2
MTSPPNRPRGSARVPGPDPDGPGGVRDAGQPGRHSVPGNHSSTGNHGVAGGDYGTARHGAAGADQPYRRGLGGGGGRAADRPGAGTYGGSARPTGSTGSAPREPGTAYGRPARHGADDEPPNGRHSAGGGGRHSTEPPTGSASVGGATRRSAFGSGATGSASVGSASVGSASVGSASVGSASVGGAGMGRATVRPAGPDGPTDFFRDDGSPLSRAEERRRSHETPKARKKRRRRRRIIAGVAVLLLLTGIGTIGGAFYFTNVTLPGQLPTPQASTFYYDDGKTPMARLGASDSNRNVVDIDKVPERVQYAVVAAEDNTFFTNSGVDVKGTIRALWNNVTGGDTQGASTITQQYAKLSEDANTAADRTYTQKLKEAVVAVKLDQKYSKKQILGFYLNAVYFGRGAYGIQAAAKVYYNKDISKLTTEEAAVLASVIKDPSQDDPAVNKKLAQARWEYTLRQMTKLGKYDKSISLANYPMPKKPKANTGASFGLDKPTGFVVTQVINELARNRTLSDASTYAKAREETKQRLETGGYKIVTTINKKAEEDAISSAHEVMNGDQEYKDAQKQNKHRLATALVSVQPGTGKVIAYYGGDDGTGFDMAANPHQPGSSFKVYSLALGIKDGISVKSLWNGDEAEKFDDRGGDGKVHNSDGEHCSDGGMDAQGHELCTLSKATVMSLNTVFYALTQKLGKDKVLDFAHQAGINMIMSDGSNGKPAHKFDLNTVSAQDAVAQGGLGNEIGFGQYPVTPLDHANGYATLAAGGKYSTEHFVTKVTDSHGVQVELPKVKHRQLFDASTAADLDWVLKQVAGNERQKIDPPRDQANKTGTWEWPNKEGINANSHAWMCGYVPQLATVVWIGRKKGDGPIYNMWGAPMYGSEYPSYIWKAYMSKAVQDLHMPPQNFPPPVYGGSKTAGQVASSSPSPKPTHSTNPHPTGRPTNSVTPPGGWPPGTGTPSDGPSSPTCNIWDPNCKSNGPGNPNGNNAAPDGAG